VCLHDLQYAMHLVVDCDETNVIDDAIAHSVHDCCEKINECVYKNLPKKLNEINNPIFSCTNEHR